MDKIFHRLNDSEDYVTGNGLLLWGLSFFKSYQCIKRETSSEFYPVNYYLLGHCLELLMKGKLRNEGFSIEKLKFKYAHNLSKLQEELEMIRAISFSPIEKQAIFAINEYYNVKEFEYFGSVGVGLPVMKDLEDIIIKCAKKFGIAARTVDEISKRDLK